MLEAAQNSVISKQSVSDRILYTSYMIQDVRKVIVHLFQILKKKHLLNIISKLFFFHERCERPPRACKQALTIFNWSILVIKNFLRFS